MHVGYVRFVCIAMHPVVLAHLYIATVTRVIPRDVLYELCKVISGTNRRDSCSFSLLLSNAPDSDRRYTAKNELRV